MNKKGLSTVVTTLIIVMMSLVAVGIVWVVVQNMTNSGSETVDYSSKCLLADVKPESATYDAYTDMITVNLKRSAAGGEETEIGGVKVTITKADGTTVTSENSDGNIALLETKPYTTTGTFTEKPTKVLATVYFTKDDGSAYLCPSGNTLSVIADADSTPEA